MRARLAKQLYHLAERYPAHDSDQARINLRLHQHDMANLLGCSRQRVNEHLQWMTARKIICSVNGHIHVQDREGLAELGEIEMPR